MNDSAVNLSGILARIEAARKKAVAPAPSTTLIAVTKTHAAAAILPVLQAGHRVFGENRVQEALGKFPGLRAEFPDLELHLIGPLQTNKAKDAVAHFDVIETLDRPHLAEVLAHEMARSGRRLPCYVEINTGEEAQKAGILPAGADQFIRDCRERWDLLIEGLMCIPPADEEPALHFALLREIARRNDLEQLSMGMSADFETAIRFGATHVRVGTAIFGPRRVVR